MAKVRGQAGTDWRTELCTGNLSNRGIRITVVAGNDSTLDLRTLVNRGSDDTVCHDDVIADLFNRSSFNRWLLTAAYPDDGICRMPIQMDLYGKDHVIGDLSWGGGGVQAVGDSSIATLATAVRQLEVASAGD